MAWNFGDSSDEEERTDRFKSERSITKTDSSSNKILPSYGSLDRRDSPKNKVRERRTSDHDRKKRSRSRSSHRKLDGRERRHSSGDRHRNNSLERGRQESRDRVRQDSREKSRNKSRDPLRLDSDPRKDDHDRERFHSKHVPHTQCSKVRSSHDRHGSRDVSPKHSHNRKSSDRKRSSPITKNPSPEIKKSNSESKKSKHRSPSPSPKTHSSKRDNGTVIKSSENHKIHKETKLEVSNDVGQKVSAEKVVKVKKCKRKAKLQEKESLENRDLTEDSKKCAKVEKTVSSHKSSRDSPVKKLASIEKNLAPTKELKKESKAEDISSKEEGTKQELPDKKMTVPKPDTPEEENQIDDATSFLCKDNTDTGDRKEERVYGPSLPERPAIDESQSYGPALPPSMAPRSDIPGDQRSVSSSPSPREGSPESDDGTIGPALPGAEPDIAQIALQHRARILQMHQSQENNSGKERPEREEWMTQLPEKGQALGLGLAARGFRTRDSDAQRDDSWTDTPEEKARKKRLAQAGVVEPSKKKVVKEEDIVAKQRDEAMEKIAKKHKKDKSKSLLEMHQDKLKKQKKDKNEKPERRPFSRETDLNVNQLSDAQKKSIYKKASALDSRFSSGQAKYL